MEGSSVLNIGSRRELFVDHYLIGKLTNTTLKLHEPRNEGVALQMDKPWEAPYPDYVSVVKDGDLYRMWFGAGMGSPVAEARPLRSAMRRRTTVFRGRGPTLVWSRSREAKTTTR